MSVHQQAQNSKNTDGVFRKRRQAINQKPASLTQRTHPAAILQRARVDPGSLAPADVMQLQRTIGNQVVGTFLSGRIGPQIQTKLILGPVGDKYEHEADRVAKQVVSMTISPSQQPVQRVGLEKEALAQMKPADVQRVGPEEEELEEEELAQMKPQAAATAATVDPGLETAILQARGSGRPLTADVRGPMERAFGADFSGVKVHTNAESDTLNRSLNARAFTAGQDIFFKVGEYSPDSTAGQELIAHELAHVVQQNGAKVQRKLITWKTPQVTGIGRTRIQRITLDEHHRYVEEEMVLSGGMLAERYDTNWRFQSHMLERLISENRRTRQVLRRLLRSGASRS